MPTVKKTTKVVKTAKTVKKTVKAVVPIRSQKIETEAPVKESVKSLTIAVYDVNGKKAGQIKLPEELFGVKVNQQLLSQSVRVYLANQRQGSASTKTRGEVEGSTRKIYKQKGTGRARHGSIRAPIFVGGGIVFGPKPRDYRLKMPETMRRKALAGALTNQLQSDKIIVIEGLSDIEPKTKLISSALKALGVTGRNLLVTASFKDGAVRAGRNIEGLTILPAQNLNSYAVLSPKKIVFMKEAIGVLQKTFVK